MTIDEQKDLLIQKIKIEKDENMLSSIYHLLERDFAIAETDKVYLNDEQKAAVQRGLEDIKAGRVYTHEEVMERIQKKLASYK